MEKKPKSLYKVRFSDCDLFGHLNNARYIDYFLNAREDHLKDHYDFDLRNFYVQGLSWLVGSHEIIYKRPAQYNEMISISSSLIKVLPDALFVEMVMKDEKETHIKSIVWTNFVPVNVKTGKKDTHPESFLEFAHSIENNEFDISSGIRARESFLRNTMKPAGNPI